MSDDRLKGREALSEIGARLGDLFGNLRDAVDEINKGVVEAKEKARQQGSDETDAEGVDIEINTPAGPVRAKAGWNVRVGVLGGDGSTSNDFSSDPVKRPEAAAQPEARTCLVDTYDEASAWVMTAELPGVVADDVAITIEGLSLHLQTNGERRYAHRADLPEGLDADAMQTRLVNGILEIRIPKRDADGAPNQHST